MNSGLQVLKLPSRRYSNPSLSSVLESHTSRRVQPPKTLCLSNKAFRDQQTLKQKMASVESIGACSLDFETSAMENINPKDLTASECTLQSNGDTPSIRESSRNGNECFSCIMSPKEQRVPEIGVENTEPGAKSECTVAEIKLPSYLSISCAINGYTNYSRFCRSRDNSPARSSFRKSSLEPSVLSEMNSNELHSLPTETLSSNYRCSRSHSDCNGTMQSIYTESRHVTISKQLQIPIKSSKKCMTEVTITNGHSIETSKKIETNGHNDDFALAKEVGNGETKSLVQQRIESLYGKSATEEMTKTPVKQKITVTNGSAKKGFTKSPSPGKNHLGSVSPPVFRHLTKDFRKQLQGNVEGSPEVQLEINSLRTPGKLQNLSREQSPVIKNGHSTLSNGDGHDECDRIVSGTTPIVATVPKKKSLAEDLISDRDGYKYLKLVDVEKEKIQRNIEALEVELLNPSIPEEASGKIRVACGKANLLITQKFEQFKGLCKKNIEENPDVPFYTTSSDLAGFWDLVMLQVDDINASFQDIQAIKQNNWQEVIPHKPVAPEPRVKAAPKVSTPKRSAKAAELAKARDEARRQLLLAKKRGRHQQDITIFAPAN